MARQSGPGLTLPNLMLARNGAGLTQSELAAEFNKLRGEGYGKMQAGAISALERQTRGARPATARMLAQILGKQVWQLASNKPEDLRGTNTGTVEAFDS